MGEALRRIASETRTGAGSDLYEPVIGSWSVDSVWYDPQGNERTGRGEWHFERILGGLGVQDVLFAEGSAPHEYGTSLRTYDSTTDLWHIVWMQPASGEFAILVARAAGADIVQEGRPLTGGEDRMERWWLTELRGDSFTWLGEGSRDSGETWQLEQRMHARRMRT